MVNFNTSYASNAGEIVSFLTEGVLFGFYICLALCALYALAGHQEPGRLRTNLLSVTLCLIVLSAADLILATTRIITALFGGPKLLSVDRFLFLDQKELLAYARVVIQTLTFALGNSVLIYKSHKLKPRLVVTLIPSAFVIASLVLGLWPNAELAEYSAVMTFMTNILVTGIIATRLWRANHCFGRPFSSRKEKLAIIYLESAGVLILFLSTLTIFAFTSTIGKSLLTAMTVPIAAITYTFAIARIGLGDKITEWLKQLANVPVISGSRESVATLPHPAPSRARLRTRGQAVEIPMHNLAPPYTP